MVAFEIDAGGPDVGSLGVAANRLAGVMDGSHDEVGRGLDRRGAGFGIGEEQQAVDVLGVALHEAPRGGQRCSPAEAPRAHGPLGEVPFERRQADLARRGDRAGDPVQGAHDPVVVSHDLLGQPDSGGSVGDGGDEPSA